MAKPQNEGALTPKEMKKVVGGKGDIVLKTGQSLKNVEVAEVMTKAVVIRCKTGDKEFTLLLSDITEFVLYGKKLVAQTTGQEEQPAP